MSYRSFTKSELESPDAPLCVQSEQDILSDPCRIVHCNLIEFYLHKLEQLGCHQDYDDQVKNEKEFYFKVNKYLDIDYDDEILFLDLASDDIYSYWPDVIETKFCLTNPIDACHLRFDKKENEYKLMRIKEKRIVSRDEKKYDKIIVKNCMKFFQNRERDFCEFLLSLLKQQTQDKASILIIQRVCDLNTLPYSTTIASEWLQNDVAYTKFMEALQQLYFTLNYDIEIFKTYMPCKSSWFRQLAENTTYPLNPRGLIVDSTHQRRLEDVRELNEGLFKYHPFDECVEITDRLLFIGTYRPLDRDTFLEEMKRKIKRIGAKADQEVDKEIKNLYMEITPDIKDLVKKLL